MLVMKEFQIVNGLGNTQGSIKEVGGKWVVYGRNGNKHREFENLRFAQNYLQSLGYILKATE